MSAVMALSDWASLLPTEANMAWLADVRQISAEADARRALADYNTGSITEKEAYLLRAIAERLQARVVIEVGTFIGTSTCALASASSVERVYTCDASNDCLPNSGAIVTFPRQTSTQMLQQLVAIIVRADLCFFDGVLSDQDVQLLARVCRHDAVFVVHDYNYGPKIRKHGLEIMPRKGVGNVQALQRQWPTHRLVDPLPETTLAVLVPEAWL